MNQSQSFDHFPKERTVIKKTIKGIIPKQTRKNMISPTYQFIVPTNRINNNDMK